jgi:hypothetical protein
MNAATLHPLARDYLKRLKKAAAILPRSGRNELIEEIESHLSEALPPGATEAEALNVLERLGEPGQIVAEAAPGAPLVRAGALEWIATILLLIGGLIIPVVGWIAGVVLLWASKVWTLRDKLVGTLVVPGGLALPVFLALVAFTNATSPGSCSGTEWTKSINTGTGAIHTSHAVVFSSHCAEKTSSLAIALLIVLLVAAVLAIATSFYLVKRARRIEAIA